MGNKIKFYFGLLLLYTYYMYKIFRCCFLSVIVSDFSGMQLSILIAIYLDDWLQIARILQYKTEISAKSDIIYFEI